MKKPPDYSEFAKMLYGTGIISDPWIGGAERFGLHPVILSMTQADRLYTAAERVCLMYDELTQILLRFPDYIDDFFGLTPWQKAMWLSSEGRWHGIARVDLFVCTDGSIRACEMNSDTPSGEAEAVLINRLLHPHHLKSIDPNVEIDEYFRQMLFASHHARLKRAGVAKPSDPKNIAIIYPTDMPEDLSMIAIYKKWLESDGAGGCNVILGSPYNIGLDDQKRVTVLSEPVDLIIRHYKTDWWGERELVWSNQPLFPDPDPLAMELSTILQAEQEARVTVVNPFGSVITQNKKSMAFMWEHEDLFTDQSKKWIREYIPETRRLTAVNPDELKREEWVLKSDFGCEGDTVVCGPFVRPGDWSLALRLALPDHWIVQRFFDVAPSTHRMLANFGVYLIGGSAAGFYTRLSSGPTDYSSITIPTFVAG